MPQCPDKDALIAQLPLLLPPGRAYQTSDQTRPGYSKIGQFFTALAEEVYRMDQEVCSAFQEFFCHAAVDSIDTWNDEYGLPDRCDPFADDLCGKVATVGEEGGDSDFLLAIAARLGWVVRLRWLFGDHPDYPGIRSSLLVEIDQENSAAAVITNFENWELPESPLGDTVASDVEPVTCAYERVLPAHVGLYSRNLIFDLKSILVEDGFGAGLELALDAGAGASYTSGQQWSDLTASANHYNRGETSGAEASDPTFNGVVNRRSDLEFFSFDGADYFTPVGAPTFGADWHKDNAKFTIMMVAKIVTSGVTQILMGTSNFSTGFYVRLTAANALSLIVQNAAALVSSDEIAIAPTGSDMLILISVDEAAATAFIQVNDIQTAFDPTYLSPSAGAADGLLSIGATPNGSSKMAAGSQVAAVAVWDGVALSQSDASQIRAILRNRWSSI